MEIAPWEAFIRSTALHAFVYAHEPWLWPTLQTLHYLGASLLLGTVGLFDLRALGMAKSIPPGAIHRLVPWGIGGYVWNLMIGTVFFFGHPDQYFYNDAFRFKLMLMALAGINILVFYGTGAFAELKGLPGGRRCPAAHQAHRRHLAGSVDRRPHVRPAHHLLPPAVLSLIEMRACEAAAAGV